MSGWRHPSVVLLNVSLALGSGLFHVRQVCSRRTLTESRQQEDSQADIGGMESAIRNRSHPSGRGTVCTC